MCQRCENSILAKRKKHIKIHCWFNFIFSRAFFFVPHRLKLRQFFLLDWVISMSRQMKFVFHLCIPNSLLVRQWRHQCALSQNRPTQRQMTFAWNMFLLRSKTRTQNERKKNKWICSFFIAKWIKKETKWKINCNIRRKKRWNWNWIDPMETRFWLDSSIDEHDKGKGEREKITSENQEIKYKLMFVQIENCDLHLFAVVRLNRHSLFAIDAFFCRLHQTQLPSIFFFAIHFFYLFHSHFCCQFISIRPFRSFSMWLFSEQIFFQFNCLRSLIIFTTFTSLVSFR